jgi:ABC-2 type transport system ATP-binding protein
MGSGPSGGRSGSEQGKPLLEARGLTKRYEDGLLALDCLSLTVGSGEILALLGANGAGKTTTINLFLNFIEPSAGQALINGIDVAALPLEAKRFVSYVPENVMLYPTFTARQNLRFFCELSGRRRVSDGSLEEAMGRVGLAAEAFDRRLGTFSKGMRQKLGIAIAVARDVPAILLDEPTAGLDPKSASEFLDLLRGLRGDGRGVLMSTHDIFRAREVCDRVAIMKAGRLVAVKDRQILDVEDLEEVYLEYMRE